MRRRSPTTILRQVREFREEQGITDEDAKTMTVAELETMLAEAVVRRALEQSRRRTDG